MMEHNTEKLLSAIGDVDAAYLEEALDFDGQRVSQLCTSPHGELFGAWNIPPVRLRSACMRAVFSKMAFSSGEK